MENPVAALESLLAERQFCSAISVGVFLVENDPDPAVIELFADALYGNKEYRRALQYYRQAQQHMKLSKLKNDERDLKLRFKMAKCHIEIGEEKSVQSLLEGVPAKDRGVEMNMILGKLHKTNGIDRAAAVCYREVLRQAPFVTDAAVALVELGVSAAEVLREAPFPSGAPSWYSTLLQAREAQVHHDHRKALQILESSSSRGAGRMLDNTQLLLTAAESHMQLSDMALAEACYTEARSMDEYVVDDMDKYASILYNRGAVAELNRLAFDLLATVGKGERAEVWTAIALYIDLKGGKEKAIDYVDKAIATNPAHQQAHLIKGQLLSGMNSIEAAVSSHRKALSLQKNIVAYAGLVEVYLLIPRFKEALYTAKEALQLMPRSPRALSLVGLVLSHSPEGRDKARRAFDKALSLEPGLLDTILSLVNLNVMEGKLTDAIDLLKKHLQHQNKDTIYAKLAEVLALNKEYETALVYYHTALSLNPNHLGARKGIEKLEKFLKGMDPESDETDEEGQEDDYQQEYEA